MANPDKSSEKSIEMRLAEIEDKLSKLHITEDEMKTYEKVSALIGGGTAEAASPALTPTVCSISRNRGITPRSITPRQIVRQIFVCVCNECSCGPCAEGGGGISGGGGFGGFGF